MLCPLVLRIVINSIFYHEGEQASLQMHCMNPPPSSTTHPHPHPISFYGVLKFNTVLHRNRKQIQSVCVGGGAAEFEGVMLATLPQKVASRKCTGL